MTTYHWGSHAPITHIDIIRLSRKHKEALIYADPDAGPRQLANMPDMLRALGLTATADTKDGQHILRVRGFDKDAFLLDALEGNGFVTAETRQKEATSKKEKRSRAAGLLEKAKAKSLQAAGLSFLVGNFGVWMSGRLRNDPEEKKTALLYTLSGGVLTRYGEKKADRLMDDLYGRMLARFAHEGVELPQFEHTTAEELGKPGGIIERMENFLYDYPVEINSAINAYGGTKFLKAGINQKNMGKQAAGVLATAGMLVSLLVPEKGKPDCLTLEEMMQGADNASCPPGKEDENLWIRPDEKRSIFKKLKDYVQVSPLKTAGRMAMLNNVFQAQGAWTDRIQTQNALADLQQQQVPPADITDAQKAGQAWKWNMLAAGAYFVGNSLYSISSKSSEEHNPKMAEDDPFEELYAASASILAAQPAKLREQLVKQMAYFFAEQKEISDSVDEVAAKLDAKITALASSPWAARMQQAAATSDGAAPSM